MKNQQKISARKTKQDQKWWNDADNTHKAKQRIFQTINDMSLGLTQKDETQNQIKRMGAPISNWFIWSCIFCPNKRLKSISLVTNNKNKYVVLLLN